MFFGDVAFGGKVLLVLLMGLSGLGFYLAFSYLLKSRTAGFATGIYMMFNPFTFIRWASGHNTVLLAYMVLSFAVFFFFKVAKEGGRLNILVCGLLTALMIYASPQVAYLFILFALLYMVFDLAFSSRTRIGKRIIARGTQIGFILVVAVVAAFPFFYQLIMVNLPVYSTTAEEAVATFSSTDVIQSIIPQVSLIAFIISAFLIMWWRSGLTKLYRWWKNGSIEDSSSFLIKVGRQQILFFAVLGLLSVIIVLFVIPPLTPVYYWLYDNLPGFGMFREVNKFFLISVLSLAFFVGLIADGLKQYLSRTKSSLLMSKILPVLLISLIVLASSWQFMTGDVAGSVGTVKIPSAYQDLNSWLSNQKGDFRIAFFPPANWATNYTWAPRGFLDPYVALQPQATVDLQSSQDLTQSASLTRWIYSALYSNRTSDWGKLLSILGVKYLILRLDADMPASSSELSGFSLQKTLAAWGSQSGLQLEANFSSVLVYENPNFLPTLYQANELSLIFGDRDTLISLANMNFDFSSYPAAFADDNIGLIDTLINDSQYIFFQGDPYWNLLASYLDGKYIVKPWNYVPISADPTDKWVSGALMWYVYGGDLNVAPDGYIYTEGANAVTVPLQVKNSGDYRILIQVYDGLPNSQGINFKVDNSPSNIFTPTRSGDGSYIWVDLGNQNLNPQSKLQISNLGGSAAISKITAIPESLISQAVQNVSELLNASNAREVYIFDDRVWDYSTNALLTNAAANNGRLIDLSKSSVQTEFYVFNEGTYSLNLTFQSPAESTAIKVQFDDVVQNVPINSSANSFLTEVKLGPFVLSQGYHNVSIAAEKGDVIFNMAKLNTYESDFDMAFHNSTVADIPDYTVHSGSEYSVTVTSRYFAFLEAGNDYWQLNGKNGAISPVCIFNYGNLYSINEPNSQFTLRYIGLDFTQQGFIIAIVGIVLTALGLKFLRFKRIKQETLANEV